MSAEHTDMSAMRATAHPLRLRILSLLTGSEMSAAELARELGVSHANASYHLRFLADTGLVVEAGEEKIRGGVAKRYRYPWDAEPAMAKGSREDSELYMRAVAEELVRRYADRKSGTKAYSSDAEMWVTPEVWQRVVALVEQASHLVHAEAQRPRTPGTIHVNLTAATFQMHEDGQAAGEAEEER